MPKYLVEASYTPEGMRGLLKDGGTARRTTLEKTVANIGGRLDSFYFAFGDADVYVLLDLPDNVTAAALATQIAATGAVRLRSHVLISPEEMDDATHKIVDYRPPGA